MLERDSDRKITIFPLPYNIELTPYRTEFNEKVFRYCKEDGTIDQQKLSKVIIIGDVNVGKTSLVNRFCSGKFDSKYKATIGIDFEVVQFNVLDIPFSIQIWDTAGQERFRSLAKSYYRQANVIVIVFDLGKIGSLINCRQWCEDALKENENKFPPPFVFLVGNKLDSLTLGCYDSIHQFVVRMVKDIRAEYWPVSSKTGINITQLFKRIAALAFHSKVLQEITSAQVTKIDIGKLDITAKDLKEGKLKNYCHSCNYR
ncbi:hypothetical protein O3M35_010818 [Rhynocoris fuscipes]|uniref:Ras-related protein Rab-36 n=1 Tax=Rhynocoris fuscipes TaxID=488301 RepID=A0AAW1D0I0_9HEMI